MAALEFHDRSCFFSIEGMHNAAAALGWPPLAKTMFVNVIQSRVIQFQENRIVFTDFVRVFSLQVIEDCRQHEERLIADLDNWTQDEKQGVVDGVKRFFDVLRDARVLFEAAAAVEATEATET